MLENDRTARLLLRDLLEHAPEPNRCLAEEVFGSNFSSIVAIVRDSQIHRGLRKELDPAMAATMMLAANLFCFQGRDLLTHFRDVDFAGEPAHF